MSYDEQRISDQIDGGLYHKNQQEMTQETMTKEQILWNLIIKDPNYIYDFKDYDEFLNEVKNSNRPIVNERIYIIEPAMSENV